MSLGLRERNEACSSPAPHRGAVGVLVGSHVLSEVNEQRALWFERPVQTRERHTLIELIELGQGLGLGNRSEFELIDYSVKRL